MVVQSTLTKTRVADRSRVEPLPDPPHEPDMRQPEAIYYAYEVLRPFFPEDTLVSGQGFLILNAGDRGEFFPDLMLTKGVVDPRAVMWRNGYVINEVGKPPDFVMEVASQSTGVRDYTVKRVGYARLGALEYWRFDPSGGRWHDAPLAGDVLVDGVYVPVEIVSEPDGRHWGYSETLGLELWWVKGEAGWEGGDLRFQDPVRGEFLPTYRETMERAEAERTARESAEAQVESERVAREMAESQAGVERAARESAEERADAAEVRMARMEAELRRLRGDDSQE